jgi:hypothetical protein
VSEQDEGFLNRWSRRKQEAAKEPLEDAAKVEEKAAPAEQADTANELTEEEFDISTLPPIDSITAGTDIRAFLSKGVPAALTQAALRRAWSADPAIRDYIGLSEYSWDFNTPGQYGFGTLDPSLNVQEMVADVFGKVKEAIAEADKLIENADTDAPESPAIPSEPPHSVELRSESAQRDSAKDSEAAKPATETGDKNAQATAASQQLESESEQPVSLIRRHGSALPI